MALSYRVEIEQEEDGRWLAEAGGAAERFEAVRGDPTFRAFLEELATRWIEQSEANPEPSQLELMHVALAHNVGGEPERAIETLERALAVGGPIHDEVERELAALRRRTRVSRAVEGPRRGDERP